MARLMVNRGALASELFRSIGLFSLLGIAKWFSGFVCPMLQAGAV